MNTCRGYWALGAVLSLCLPESVAAVQVGATVNLGTGPMAWDQSEARGRLLQGSLGTTYRTPVLLGLQPELIGEFGLSSEPAERTAMRWDLGARLHTRGSGSGAWLGAAVGGAGANGPTNRVTRLEGGVRRAIGRAGIDLWVSRTSFGSAVAPRGTDLAQDSAPRLDTLHTRVDEYAELGSRAVVGLGRYEVGLTVLRRLGSAAVRRTGWEVSATWWLAPSLGLVGSAGRSLPQFGFAVPGGRYGTVGLRMALGNRRPSRHPEKPSTTDTRVLVSARRFSIVGVPARRTEVMGDFTDWEPVTLVQSGAGVWEIQVQLTRGVHRLNIRVDGGDWSVPLGARTEADEFGGMVGVIVVQ